MFNWRNNNSTKTLCLAMGVFCFAIVVTAIALQFALDLPYCSRCVLQRWVFIGVGLMFCLTAVAKRHQIIFLFAGCCGSLLGLYVSIAQFYPRIIAFVDQGDICSLVNAGISALAVFSFLLSLGMSVVLGLRFFRGIPTDETPIIFSGVNDVMGSND